MTTEFFVRLKPRPAKRRKGIPQTPARYMYRGVRFEEEKGWYRIKDTTFAKELAALTHNDREDGTPIFDVATPEQAKQIQAKEKRPKSRREVEDAAEIQTTTSVSPRTRRGKELAGGAVSRADVTPEAEPAMIDGADGEEDESEEEGEQDEAEALGKLDGAEQELDDGDDLLEPGGREPRAPKVTPEGEEKAKPQTRKKGGGKSKS